MTKASLVGVSFHFVLNGFVSFAFYLMHRLVLMYARDTSEREHQRSLPASAGLLLAALPISAGLATLPYTLVEIQIMRALTGRAKRLSNSSSPGL
jgi:peptidoglycan/LPS O-acetylase OafA/YrhL